MLSPWVPGSPRQLGSYEAIAIGFVERFRHGGIVWGVGGVVSGAALPAKPDSARKDTPDALYP